MTEVPSAFDYEDEPTLAAKMIRDFNQEFGGAVNIGGVSEEMAACTRAVRSLVHSNGLNKNTLTALFSRANASIPIGSTYLLAYRAIDAAAEEGKLDANFISMVITSIESDVNPLWTSLDMQEKENERVLSRLMSNSHLLGFLLPVIVPEE